MRNLAIRFTGFLLSALLLVVVGELVLRMLPHLKGMRWSAPTEQIGHARLLPNAKQVYSQGWDFREVSGNQTNSDGYVAPYDYRKDRPGVALLGDSFAEGLSLPFDHAMSGALNRRLGQPDLVYNFGMSSASLAHHLGVAKVVGQQYPLQSAVVIISGNDYVEGFYSSPGMYKWTDKPDSGLVELVKQEPRSGLTLVLRDLSWLPYLRHHLKASYDRLFAQTSEAVEALRCDPATAADFTRVESWLAQIGPALKLAPKQIVLLFDADRDAIYRSVDSPKLSPTGCQSVDKQTLNHLRIKAQAAGFQVINGAPLFEAAYRADRAQLDYSPADRHWNPKAVNLLADEVARRLKSQ